jgi:hypothetical protein
MRVRVGVGGFLIISMGYPNDPPPPTRGGGVSGWTQPGIMDLFIS